MCGSIECVAPNKDLGTGVRSGVLCPSAKQPEWRGSREHKGVCWWQWWAWGEIQACCNCLVLSDDCNTLTVVVRHSTRTMVLQISSFPNTEANLLAYRIANLIRNIQINQCLLIPDNVEPALTHFFRPFHRFKTRLLLSAVRKSHTFITTTCAHQKQQAV